jgi:hypothetical protein
MQLLRQITKLTFPLKTERTSIFQHLEIIPQQPDDMSFFESVSASEHTFFKNLEAARNPSRSMDNTKQVAY